LDWVLGGGCRGVDYVVLLATDTPEGRAAARVLDDHLSRRGCPSRVRVVPGLGAHRLFWAGLADLVRVVAEEARSAYTAGSRVYLNATGGFKPESGAALLAAMAAAPVVPYYKHEAMRETVFLPLLPVALDRGRLAPMAAKLRLLAEAQEPLAPDDPLVEDNAWLIEFMEKTGLAARSQDGRITLTTRARELAATIAAVYEALDRSLA
jgi:putative CRISPR-associated protein (TIGR02619 family)